MTIKKVILFLVSLVTAPNCNAQSLEWGINIGQHTEDVSRDLDKTSDGVIFTTNTSIYSDIYGLGKYDEEGNLLWQADFISKVDGSADYYFLDTAVDENNNIYTTISLNSEAVDINEIFIAHGISLLKLDTYGNLIWSRKISELISDNEIKLLYKDDNLFVLGNFQETVLINDQISLTSQLYWDCISKIYRPSLDYFIAKFDVTGNLLNAVSFGTEYPNYVVSATIDENSNIYFTGGSNFRGSCTIRYTHITKFNDNLELQWEKIISKEENNSNLLYPANIYYSESSNSLYLWAHNISEVKNADYTIPTSPCATRMDAIGAWANLMEFNASSGNFIKYRHFPNCTVNDVWQVGGTVNSVTIDKMGIAEKNNNLIILSSIHGSMEFDNGTFESTHLISEYDEFIWDENLFLMKVDKDNFSADFIVQFPGETDNEYPESVDNPQKIIIGGDYLYLAATFECNPIHIFGSPIYNNSGNNDGDALLAKVNLSSVLSNDSFAISGFEIYPNPTSQFLFFKTKAEVISRVDIYSSQGNLIKTVHPESVSGQLNLTYLASGLYVLRFKSKNNNIESKRIIF